MPDAIDHLNAALEGRYGVEKEVGRGGMATVYLAHDLRHDRDVALKVLQPEVAEAVGAKRFLDEIKTTAGLKHPNILPLFDSGEAAGHLFYVMPFMEGRSLRSRLDDERQLPVDDAVRIGIGVLRALDHAHRHGIVHRDIKPGNILLQDGEPVVADFGIALAVSRSAGDRLTETGIRLGTPQYMSPEQTTGEQTPGPATDIWAVGCLLYEMLAGEAPFSGGTPQAILGKIIATGAAPVTERRPTTPANVAAAIGTALEKVPADRFGSAHAFAAALTDARYRGHASIPNGKGPGRLAVGSIAFLMGALAWAGIGALRPEPDAGSAREVRFRIEGSYIGTEGRVVAISPDGRRIAHAPRGGVLSVRSLDRTDASSELVLNGAKQPFFSPDGTWIGYFVAAGANLWKIPATGGAPRPIASGAARSMGASWGTDGTIVFATTVGLYRVSAEGGDAELLAAPDVELGELYYAYPQILPGGRAALFTLVPDEGGTDTGSSIVVLDLETLERSIVLRGGGGARYVPSGHLVFSAEGRLNAVAFDPRTRAVRGDPVPLDIDGVAMARGPVADFDVSEDGTLVYAPVASPARRILVWIGADGTEEPLAVPPLRYIYPRISPDGSRIAVDAWRDEPGSGANRDLFLWDIRRESLTRLTRDPAEDLSGEWSPDGSTIYFSSNRTGAFNVFARAADGTGEAVLVRESATSQWVNGPVLDGDRLLVAQVRDGAADFDMVSFSARAPDVVDTLLSTESWEESMALSPDGRWLAYQSTSPGVSLEVFVGPYPNVAGRRWQISTDGGAHPLWSRDGTRLFYRAPTGDIMAVAVETSPDFRVGDAARAFPNVDDLGSGTTGGRRHDISPVDGRLLVTKPVEEEGDNGIVVVLNWAGTLDDRVGGQ